MLTINPLSTNLYQNNTAKQKSTVTGVKEYSLSSHATGIPARQGKGIPVFTASILGLGKLFKPLKPGSKNEDLPDLIEATQLGDGYPLVVALKEGWVSASKETKAALLEGRKISVKENNADSVDWFNDAIQFIDKKMQGKQ